MPSGADGPFELDLFEGAHVRTISETLPGKMHCPGDLHHARENGVFGKMSREPFEIWTNFQLHAGAVIHHFPVRHYRQFHQPRSVNSAGSRALSILPMALPGSPSTKRHLRGTSTGSYQARSISMSSLRTCCAPTCCSCRRPAGLKTTTAPTELRLPFSINRHASLTNSCATRRCSISASDTRLSSTFSTLSARPHSKKR